MNRSPEKSGEDESENHRQVSPDQLTTDTTQTTETTTNTHPGPGVLAVEMESDEDEERISHAENGDSISVDRTDTEGRILTTDSSYDVADRQDENPQNSVHDAASETLSDRPELVPVTTRRTTEFSFDDHPKASRPGAFSDTSSATAAKEYQPILKPPCTKSLSVKGRKGSAQEEGPEMVPTSADSGQAQAKSCSKQSADLEEAKGLRRRSDSTRHAYINPEARSNSVDQSNLDGPEVMGNSDPYIDRLNQSRTSNLKDELRTSAKASKDDPVPLLPAADLDSDPDGPDMANSPGPCQLPTSDTEPSDPQVMRETFRQSRIRRQREEESDDDDFISPENDMHLTRPGAVRESGYTSSNEDDDMVSVVDNLATDTRTVYEGPQPQRRSQETNRSIDPTLIEAVPVNDDEETEQASEQYGSNDDSDRDLEAAVLAEEVDVEKTKGIKGWIRLHKRLVVLMLSLFTIIVTVAIVLTSLGVVGDDIPTNEEIFLSQASLRAVQALELMDQYTVSFRDAMVDPTSPQYQALIWLADQDGLQVSLDILFEANVDLVQATQRYILATMYFSTAGEDWSNQIDFLAPSSECTWNAPPSTENEANLRIGVFCDGDGIVTTVDIPNNNLNGTIATEVASLSSLQRLSVGNNPMLRGTIPGELFNATQLQDLRLLDCSLTGALPDTLGEASALVYLALQNNQLSGSVPSTVGKLEWLEHLYIQNNLVTGSIPTEMGSLSELRFFFAEQNLLTGSIPSEMAQLTDLKNLNLSYNSLNTGANELCSLRSEDGSLNEYITDCFGSTLQAVAKEIDCVCCTLCCADVVGCLPNGVQPAG